MANPEHIAILKQGIEQWNAWRRERPNDVPNLHRANLNGADLMAADLSGANLQMANLCGAVLIRANLGLSVATAPRGADLSGADLTGANLSMANLNGADVHGTKLIRSHLNDADLSWADFHNTSLVGAFLDGADLTGTNLRGANLASAFMRGATLHGADLSGTDLTEAVAGGTHFADLDLSVTKGLRAVKHTGPSTVGINTIYKSHGNIEETFLRGCGVPDEFIAYIGSMVGHPIEFYSCFISYSTKDQEFADRLYADLQANGVRCWFAPHDIQGGKKIHEQIDEAIRLHDKLLLILSEDSMKSEWVKTEIAKARKRETKDGKRVLFPVRLVGFEALRDWECFDADTGKDSAREIREYFIPDFSNWKEHDSYRVAFDRLVKDLKAGAGG